MNKKLKLVITIVVALVVLGFVKNMAIGFAIEQAIGKAAHVPAHIGSTNVSFLTASMSLKKVKIQNPRSFPRGTMLDVPEVGIHFDPPALLKGVAHFKSVKLNLKELVVVKNKDGKVNLEALKPTSEEKKKPEVKKAEPGKKTELQIDRLQLTVGRVVYRDYSGGGEPKEQVFEIGIQDRVYSNIRSVGDLVRLITAEALARTALGRILDLDIAIFTDSATGILGTGANLVDEGAETVSDTAKGLLGLFQ